MLDLQECNGLKGQKTVIVQVAMLIGYVTSLRRNKAD